MNHPAISPTTVGLGPTRSVRNGWEVPEDRIEGSRDFTGGAGTLSPRTPAPEDSRRTPSRSCSAVEVGARKTTTDNP
jgi:hypothetical protein